MKREDFKALSSHSDTIKRSALTVFKIPNFKSPSLQKTKKWLKVNTKQKNVFIEDLISEYYKVENESINKVLANQ